LCSLIGVVKIILP